jgi:Family of unknown function (DUF5335)
MRRREIARETWQEFFDSFSGQHEGWLVGVDRFDEFLDETVETRHLDGALRGVQSDDGAVALAVDDRSTGHLETESIHDPQRIVLEQSEDEVDTALEIDGSQSCIILRFHTPMSAEMVDGIAS